MMPALEMQVKTGHACMGHSIYLGAINLGVARVKRLGNARIEEGKFQSCMVSKIQVCHECAHPERR